MKLPLFTLLLACFSINLFAQEPSFETLSQTPRDTSLQFPLDYKIARPRLSAPQWDDDYDAYVHFHTPAIRKTQASMSYKQDGVTVFMTPNSIIPHAQLDTATIADDAGKFIGTWRMLKFRSIRYNDSVDIPTSKYYRLPDTLLHDRSQEEAFAVISDSQFKLYAKTAGKKDFKRMMAGKYKIENRRFIMLYKLAKAGAGVSQIGMDEHGRLILNYPKVIEYQKNGSYFSYYAVVEQYIFERAKL